MTSLRDYLKEKAKFYSPPTTDSSISSTDINDLEVDRLDEWWKPVVAFHDSRMVNTLLETLDEVLGDRSLPTEQHTFDELFEPVLDKHGTKDLWKSNSDEFEASHFVQYRFRKALLTSIIKARMLVDFGALQALQCIMRQLGYPITVLHNTSPPGRDFSSLVDYAIFVSNGEGKRVLLEIESPSCLEHNLPNLQRRAFRIYLQSSRPTDEKVINKVCLYMSSHKAHWLALTSHNKWVFLRLHPDKERPYITYSNVLDQKNNTQPFCAFLAMVLSTVLNRNVESHVDTAAPLSAFEEDNNNENNKDSAKADLREDKSGTYKDSNKETREKRPTIGYQPTRTRTSPDLLIAWSGRVVSETKWLPFSKVGGTERSLPSGSGAVHLWLQRGVGKGATSVVYEATLSDDEPEKASSSHSYAVKVAVKGKTEEEKRCIACLNKEFEAYCKIEQAKRDGKMEESVTPGCYGLYESRGILALVLDCEGGSLTDEEWRSLSPSDKSRIFELLSALHKIGIAHCDFEPRNIVRTSAGSYKVIDFSMARFHNCPGIRELSWYKGKRNSRKGCAELRYNWEELVGQRVESVL